MAFRVLFLILAAKTAFAFLQLDYSEDGEQIYTCEIDGIVDQNLHQLHGTLVNCQSPFMECWIDANEYLLKSRTNVKCRVPSGNLFFHDDKLCSFRFYYRRSYCTHNTRCYSLTMSCHSVSRPTELFYWLIGGALVFIILVIALAGYLIYDRCYKATELSIPKQDRRLEKVRRQSLKLKEKEQEEKERRARKEYNELAMETTF